MKISFLTSRLKALFSSAMPFAVLSAVLYYREHWLFGIFAFIALVNTMLSIVHPVLVKPVLFVLESIIKGLRIIFTILFILIMQCIIFSLIRFIGAVFGKRFMGTGKEKESYYMDSENSWIKNMNEPF